MSWQAPRIAYELAADWARERIAGNRGASDPLPPVPAAWKDLTPDDQREVLEVLSGHARGARALLSGRGLAGRLDAPAETHRAGAAQMCKVARQSLMTLLADEPADVMPPACQHCMAIAAAALIAVAWRCYELAGFSPDMIAGHWAAAARGAGIPAQRQAC